MKILLIEDSEIDALLFQEQAKHIINGYEIVHVFTMKEAWKMLHKIDVIVCNLELDDSPCQDTVKVIGQWAQTWPVIIFSGLDDSGVMNQCRDAGVVVFLVKGQISAVNIQDAVKKGIDLTSKQQIRTKLKEIEDTAQLFKDLN